MSCQSLIYRIIAAAAAGATPEHALQTQPRTTHDSIALHRVRRILGTGGFKSAHAGQIGGHCPLIQLDGGDCGQFHGACSRWTIPGSVTAVVRAFGSGRPSSVRRKRLCVARRIWVKSAPPAPRLAMTIASQPGAVGQFRTASRMRRLVWFRTTALPTRLPATMQKRLRSMPLGSKRITSRSLATLRPVRWTSPIRLSPVRRWRRCI